MLLKYTRIFKENNPEFIQNQLKIIENYFNDPSFKDKQNKLLEYFLIVKHNYPIVYELHRHEFEDEYFEYYFVYKIAETVINVVRIYEEENQLVFEFKTILEETYNEIEAILELQEEEIIQEFNEQFDWENCTAEERELELQKLDVYIEKEFGHHPESFRFLKNHLDEIEKFNELFFKSLKSEFKLVLTQEQRLDFCQGLQLFLIFQDRYIWYSENRPNRSESEIIPIIQAFERWKFIFEPIFLVNKSFSYDYSFKGYPLVFEYISISQMCWYFYTFEESLNILEHSLEQSILYLKEKHNGETPFFQLTELTSEIDWKIWNNPEDFYYFNFLYIAEIYEKLENYDKAIENYKIFLTYIPNFENKLKKNYSSDFFHLCKKVPDTKAISNIIKKLNRKV